LRERARECEPGSQGMTADPALAATLAATSASTAPIAPGELVADRWQVERFLGEGTFGWVFSARDQASGEPVALKVLRPEHARVDSVFVRFKRRELEVLNRVHVGTPAPNVMQARHGDTVVHRGYVLLVLELVDGPTLTDVIAKERVLDPDDARLISAGIARGLAAIHAAGGVHRDLKPDNIRLRRGTEPVILDLGIAKAMWETQTLTGTNQALMTPFYAAPEQLAGQEVGPPCDVYALGLILYEMLSGSVPLAGRTFAETLAARSTRSPPDPRQLGRPIPDFLAAQTLRCLEKEPARRPAAADIAHELERPRRVPAKRPRWILPLAGMVLAATAGLAALATSRRDATPGHPSAAAVPPPGAARSTPPPVPTGPALPAPSAFSLGINLPKKKFVAGERVKLRLISDRRAYVVLIGVAEDGSGTMLLPRSDRPAPRIEAGGAIDFPSDAEQKIRLELVATVPKMEVSARERLLAFALEERDDFDALVPPKARTSRSPLPLPREEIVALEARAAALPGAHTRAEATFEIGSAP
jgi:hypothetical protein